MVRGFICGPSSARQPLGEDASRFEVTAACDSSHIGELARATTADVLVLDSYGIDDATLDTLRNAARVRVVIDDIADRRLRVEAVINGAIGAESLPYVRSPQTALLLGGRYALLPPELASSAAFEPRPTCERVVVTLGSADRLRASSVVAEAVLSGMRRATVDVAVGPFFDSVEDLEALRQRSSRVRLHYNADVRTLARGADLAVSAGGQTTYELAALMVPTIALIEAENQRPSVMALVHHGAMLTGTMPGAEGSDIELRELIRQVDLDLELRSQLAARAAELIDGNGAVRAAEAILALLRASSRTT